MKCPVCKNHLQVDTNLQSDGFKEGITECSICGTVWSANHGVVEIVMHDAVRDAAAFGALPPVAAGGIGLRLWHAAAGPG